MSKSIRYYFFTSIAVVLVASLLVMGLLQSYLVTSYFRKDQEAEVVQALHDIDEGIRSGVLISNDTWSPALNYLANVENMVILIADPAGTVVFSTNQKDVPLGTKIPGDILGQLFAAGEYKNQGKMNGVYPRDYFTLAIPLTGPDGKLQGYAFASSDIVNQRSYLLNMLPTFFLSSALALLVSSILALLLSNRTIIPIRRVSAAARRFGEGDYTARVPVEGDDELAHLAITFNEMAGTFEATDVSRRSFMGNIAHELRTPMTTIKGFVDGMLDGTIPEDQRDRYLTIVSEEVGRLSRLTRNMLDVSRLEAGEFTPNTTVFNIWAPIAAVLIGAQQRLEEKNIRVETKDADAYVAVLADEDFVHQVLFNLVDNAIKFTDDDGEITISVQPGKTDVTVNVRNTGIGILAENIPYVFDRFYKADKSRSTNVGGAGLGLHISKVLVGMMGGRIWVDSKIDEWSDFHFTLPAALGRKDGQRRTENGNHQEAETTKEL